MRKQEFSASTEKPAAKYLEWASEQGQFKYYDKAKGQNVFLDPKKLGGFVVLMQFHTVKGWNDASQSGIWSNEVKLIGTQEMGVKSFKGALRRDKDLIEIDRAAVALAKEAAANRQVAVAGSVSTMRPVIAGSDRTSTQREWPEKDASALFRRKVENLAHCGVDLLMMEMMRDTDYSVWATEAAIATGLPVWVGISAEKNKDGVLTGFGREDMLLEDVARALAAVRPAVVSIMHTSANDTDEAIAVVRRYWKGPLGAYPESGYFRMPEGTFVDIIPTEQLVDKARVWKARGASIFGGCCGLGPEHIEALHKAFTP